MQPRIDWLGICQDWASSGLSRNRYFLSNRIARFVRYGSLPCHSSVVRHLSEFKKSNTASAENSDAISCVSDTAVIHHLEASDVSAVIADVPCGTAVSKRVSVLLANGASIEFETGSPERFALQALGSSFRRRSNDVRNRVATYEERRHAVTLFGKAGYWSVFADAAVVEAWLHGCALN